MNYLILAIISALSFSHTASATASLKIDHLSTDTSYNYFSLPNDNETNRVDLNKLEGQTAFRLFFEKEYQSWSWTLLYAPLTIEYNLTPTKSFLFNNTNFSANQSSTISYKFNSYRAGYRRISRTSFGRFYYGGLLKIRDAKICVSQTSTTDCYDNVGPVPLLNLGADYSGELVFLNFNIDGLFSSKGSAYDANIEFGFKLKYFNLGVGVRVLGGGADNETLVNFAQFRSTYINITF